LVIDPNAELAPAAPAQRFEPVAAKRAKVLKRSRGVQPDQARPGLFFDVHQFNDAQAVHQLRGPFVLERLNHTY
jgi:hypothetical protein